MTLQDQFVRWNHHGIRISGTQKTLSEFQPSEKDKAGLNVKEFDTLSKEFPYIRKDNHKSKALDSLFEDFQRWMSQNPKFPGGL